MAMPKATNPAQLNEIQRQMGQIRHEMHQEFQGAVRGAQSLTDWRSMVANHPWAAIGVAAAAGYLAVPHRRSQSDPGDAKWAAALAAASRNPAPPQPAGSPPRRSSIFRSALGLLTPVLTRAAQNYVLGQLEHWLAMNAFRLQENVQNRRGEPGPPTPADPVAEGQTIRFRDRH
jgi:hypothetical protein